MARIDDVRALADPMVAQRGFRLYDVEQAGPIVRVTVDGPTRTTGPSIDDLSAITRELSRLLDEADPISGSYTLEVSSPGLERKLRTFEHFVGAIGETTSLKIRIAGQAAERIRGIITAVTEEEGVTVELQTDNGKATGETRRVALAEINSARTIYEWGMTPPEPPAESESTGPTRRTEP